MILPPSDPRYAHISSPPPVPVDWHVWRKFPRSTGLSDIVVSAIRWVDARAAAFVLLGTEEIDGHVLDAEDPISLALASKPIHCGPRGALFVDIEGIDAALFVHLLDDAEAA